MNPHGKSTGRCGTPAARWFWPACFLLALFAGTNLLFADDAQDKNFAVRAQTVFNRAQAQYQSDTNDPVTAWQYGRACFDWAGWATNKAQRAEVARDGIAACRQSLLLTNSAAAHFYLGFNLGQLAQCEMLHGLRLVREMDHEWQMALKLDPSFDYGGPTRSLGLLYRDAPGWPLSLGNRRKALDYLQNAAALAPDDPENILNLAETYLKWGDRDNARKELDALDTLWPKAQKKLTGEAWEQDWYDWSKRRDILREKLDEP
jgi:tetratricopeptide (TPR) repeat protein